MAKTSGSKLRLGISFGSSPLKWISFRKRNLERWAVPAVVRIAEQRGSVSLHRLMTQLELEKSDAKSALAKASDRNLLYRGLDGRYYPLRSSREGGQANSEIAG